jgi:hypothetical protein
MQDGNGKTSAVSAESEIKALESLVPTMDGKTERQKKPNSGRKLARARWIIARLGGQTCYYKPQGSIGIGERWGSS